MRIASALNAAAATDPGRQRDVNEDRVHVDVARGVFMVIDGVGGHAAGGKAADIALTMMRARLERETGSAADRLREAIAAANNDIHRAAGSRAEWRGMACVLTVVIVDDTAATVGHVGDTRLYKLRGGRIEKITRDHSPVGEREDAGEISELDAMRHPRRNEVYRDVGSDLHQAGDPDFIDVRRIAFEPDAALLLCSDGLTDVVDSPTVRSIVERFAGHPDAAARALVEAANRAGGKDNISVVYVEGEQFAAAGRAFASAAEITRRLTPRGGEQDRPSPEEPTKDSDAPRRTGQRAVRVALVLLLAAVTVLAATLTWRREPFAAALTRLRGTMTRGAAIAIPAMQSTTIGVAPSESIADAIERAASGAAVVVEPGEYRETLTLKDGVRVVSRVPRAAILRLPGNASEAGAAVVAAGVKGAEFAGFRVVGDAATPLGTGLLVSNAEVAITDVEVTGALGSAIAITDRSNATILASDIHDNPGAALTIGAAAARVAHNVSARNGASERVHGAFALDDRSDARFSGNVFHDVGHEAFGHLNAALRAALVRDNSFAAASEPHPAPTPAPSAGRGRRGR